MSDRGVFEFLKAELAFLESGGYEQPPEAPWRATLIFEDSPACLYFEPLAPRHPCSECGLMKFVPKHHRNEGIPCRFIPLDRDGQTLDSLYRTATKEEILEIVQTWLKKAIIQVAREGVEKAS